MEKSRQLDAKRDINREKHKVVVYKVEHTVCSDDLGGELSEHDSSKDHGKAHTEENIVNTGWKTQDSRICTSTTTHIGHENDQNDEELPSNDESFHVITLVCEISAFVGLRMSHSILGAGNRLNTNKSTLPPFNCSKPNNEEPENNECSDRVSTDRYFCLFRKDCRHDHCYGEDEKSERVDIFDDCACHINILVTLVHWFPSLLLFVFKIDIVRLVAHFFHDVVVGTPDQFGTFRLHISDSHFSLFYSTFCCAPARWPLAEGRLRRIKNYNCTRE
mmetsp:Transcript_23307/g.68865  ORF Transcript_23307/g.68865 Transcript_23307/m.68865 type:complete len:275 (+) Transcript_23307:1219-2043(+)